MDILKVKKHLLENPNDIETLLHKVGFHKIRDNGKEYRCALSDDGNPTAVVINKESLYCNCFSKGIKGDVFILLAYKLDYEMPKQLPKIIKYVCDVLGINCDEVIEQSKVKLPFGGFFRDIKNNQNYNSELLTIYNEDILEQFGLFINRRFLIDGITATTQAKFNIGYDLFTERIAVPWTSPIGEICGVMGRLNYSRGDSDIPKWFPIIPFKKSLTLYGYSHNYKSISEKELVFVGESEKFTLQLDSMDIDVGVSLGGSNISQTQANLLKSLRPKMIITCYDEGLEEEYIIEQSKKLKSSNLFYENKVGYIYDRYNKYLVKNSKASPSDLGENVFKNLLDECVYWI